MSDNTTLPGAGEIVRTIDKGGKKTQAFVLDMGGAGAESLVSDLNRMPSAFQDDLIYLLSAILEKMPRVDAADRLMVSHAESNPTVAFASNQTVTGLTNIGGRDAAHTAFAMANVGALHIYDNIRVS